MKCPLFGVTSLHKPNSEHWYSTPKPFLVTAKHLYLLGFFFYNVTLHRSLLPKQWYYFGVNESKLRHYAAEKKICHHGNRCVDGDIQSYRPWWPLIQSWWAHNPHSVTIHVPLTKGIMIHSGHKIHDDVIKWKHFPRYWPFVRGIHRSPVNSPHKGKWRGTSMFSLTCAWINGWVNIHEAVYLSRHRAHYDVTVMCTCHNSWVVVTCAKWRPDWILWIKIGAKKIFTILKP